MYQTSFSPSLSPLNAVSVSSPNAYFEQFLKKEIHDIIRLIAKSALSLQWERKKMHHEIRHQYEIEHRQISEDKQKSYKQIKSFMSHLFSAGATSISPLLGGGIRGSIADALGKSLSSAGSYCDNRMQGQVDASSHDYQRITTQIQESSQQEQAAERAHEQLLELINRATEISSRMHKVSE